MNCIAHGVSWGCRTRYRLIHTAFCSVGPQVCFKPNIGNPQGCRALTRRSLDRMCLRAKCTILHQISNDYLDAYVLSESSLFVYPHKVSEHRGGQGMFMIYLGAGRMLSFRDL